MPRNMRLSSSSIVRQDPMLACEISSSNPSLRRAMEVSGAILRGIPAGSMPGHRRDGGDLALSIGGRRIRMSARPTAGGFSDEGHLKYYAPPVRCGERTKEEKRRSKLVKGLTKDLSALSSMDLAIEAGEGVACEPKRKMVSEALEILRAQLKQLQTEEKEMKRRRKEEKAATKAARMEACEDEDSSSSSSSESSDSDCETVVDMSSLTTEAPPNETKSEVRPIPIETPSVSNALSLLLEPKTEVKAGQDSSTNSAASNCCKISSALVENPMDRIEVCMGGKCKKSGAMELLEEFERKVGIEGAVVSCKCMGKCRDGPNVRVLNHSAGKDSLEPVKNPLCIGVGLEDVGNIVVNFFGENKDVGLMAA